MIQNLVHQFLSKSLLQYLVEKSLPQEEKDTLQQTEECLRFLFLSHLTQGSIPVSQKVDEIWHLLILQTKEYVELCQSLPAKKIIHHSSDIYLNYFALENPNEKKEESPESQAKRQLEWLVSYVVNFGPLKPENIQYWPFASGICLKFNLSLEDLNSQLKNLSSIAF